MNFHGQDKSMKAGKMGSNPNDDGDEDQDEYIVNLQQ